MRLIWTAEQRAHTRAVMREQLARFELDDTMLGARVGSSMPDGFPPQSMPGPGQRGGTSDRTAATVAVRLSHDGQNPPAETAFALLHQAARLLDQADSARAKALPPRPTVEPEDLWCASCARATDAYGYQRFFEPRTSRQGGRQDLCSWCGDEWLGSATKPEERKLPDLRLVDAHHRGVKLTAARRAEIVGKSKGGKKAVTR